MSVGVKRRYDSSRRREQAAATRQEILEAAERLFERDGYAATTMAAVAAEAGVALKTVYLAFETKSGVLRALWNLRLRGDAADVPMGERGWYRAVLAESDPRRQLALTAKNSVVVKLRIGPLLEVIRSAAASDPDAAELWGRIQSEFHSLLRAIAQSLADKKALRRGLTVERAADILWTLHNPVVWQLLGVDRDWSAAEYERWTAATSCEQLLAPRRPKKR